MRSLIANPRALCISATFSATSMASYALMRLFTMMFRELYRLKYLFYDIDIIIERESALIIQFNRSTHCLPIGVILFQRVSNNDMKNVKHPLAIQYKEDASFKKEMDEVAQRYQTALQTSLYSNLQAIPTSLLTHVCGDDKGHSVFLYMGSMQPVKTDLQEKVYLYIIRRFDDELFNNPAIKDKAYSLIFNNSGCAGSTAFNTFRLIFRTLPLQYFINLEHLFILHSNLAIRANEWLTRGTINKYIKSLTVAIKDVKDLQQYHIDVDAAVIEKFDQMTLEAKLPEEFLLAESPPKKIRQVRYGYAPEEKRITHKISTELDIEKIFYGKDIEQKPRLDELELSPVRVPVVIQSLLLCLKSRPQLLEAEGIFRKSPSIDDQKRALVHLYQKDYNFIETIDDPHLLASLVKKILMSLAEPLFPYELYEVILSHDIAQQQRHFLDCLLKKLPEPNYNTLLFLLRFFVENVIPKQELNKMSPYNVAVVLAPCLLRSHTPSMMDIQYAGHLVVFVNKLIDCFWEVFGDKKKQQLVFRKSLRKVEKTVMKRISLKPTEDNDEEDNLDNEIEKELESKNIEKQEILETKSVQQKVQEFKPQQTTQPLKQVPIESHQEIQKIQPQQVPKEHQQVQQEQKVPKLKETEDEIVMFAGEQDI